MRQLKITQQITARESLSFSKYLQEINAIPLLSTKEEVELATKIQAGDIEAFNKLIESNLRFVVSVAKQYQGSEKLEDLVNAGNEGLIVAAQRFDSTRGFKFVSYAVWWIRQSIMKHLSDNSKSIRIPSNKITLLNKIKNANSALEQKLSRKPTSEEISEELISKDVDVNVSEINNSILSDSPMVSLDMKLSEDSETTIVDTIIVEDTNNINEILGQQDLQKTLEDIFSEKLSGRETTVIIEFFGLFGSQTKTIEEIGLMFELSKNRVRQIKEKALRKLRFKDNLRVIKTCL